jgi:hypothetical protein
MLYHDEADAVRCGFLGRLLAGVPLVDIGDLDILAGGRLHRRGKPFGLRAVLFVRRGDMRRQKMTNVSTARCSFEPFRRLAPS